MRGEDKKGVNGYAVLYLLWLAFTLCYGYGVVQANLAAELHRGAVVALDAGMDVHLAKPIDMGLLKKMVRQCALRDRASRL